MTYHPDAGNSGGSPAWAGVSGKPAEFPPEPHVHTTVDVLGIDEVLDLRSPVGHGHAVADTTGLQGYLDGKAAAAHNHAIADVTGLQAALDALGGGGYQPLDSDLTAIALLSTTAYGRSLLELADAAAFKAAADRWTYVKLGADQSTSLAAAVDVTGLAFAPAANRQYEFEACLILRTATATTGPRPGLAWPTGLTDGVAQITMPTSATAQVMVNGNFNAALLAAVGGLPNTTQSYPAYIYGTVIAGAVPVGNVRVQLASETAGTNVTVKAGSYLKYREI